MLFMSLFKGMQNAEVATTFPTLEELSGRKPRQGNKLYTRLLQLTSETVNEIGLKKVELNLSEADDILQTVILRMTYLQGFVRF